MYNEGDLVIAKFGHNDVLNKPFEFVYEFGYYGKNNNVILYKKGERNMQDSVCFKLNQIRITDESESYEYPLG